MNRGDVFWHKFKEPDKKRPVLILTRDGAISSLNAVTLVQTTSIIRNLPFEVLLSKEDGLSGLCVANLDRIQTVPRQKVGNFITHLPDEKLERGIRSVRFAFGFEK